MSDSKTPETNDFEEEEKDEKEKEKDIEESEETSTIDEHETNEQNKELHTLTTRFDEISNESYTILNTLKSKMNAITKMYDDFNETTTTFNNVSNDCKSLLNTINGIKSDPINKPLTNLQKYNEDTIFTNTKYSKTYLKTLSKSELVEIVILMQQYGKIKKPRHPLQKKKKHDRRPKMKKKRSNKSIRNKEISKKQIENRDEIKTNDSIDGSGNSLNTSILIEVDESMIDEEDDCDNDGIMLETELLKLNMKMLKKRCKEYRVSSQGGKIEMIAKILKQEHKLKHELINEELNAQDDFMREMNQLSQ